jgi:hypothetical protein
VSEWKKQKVRQGATHNLAITRHAVKEITGHFPDNCDVWKLTRHCDFSKTYHTFIWKSIHNTHKIGYYWTNIDNYGHRVNCEKCRTTEDLENFGLKSMKPELINIG